MRLVVVISDDVEREAALANVGGIPLLRRTVLCARKRGFDNIEVVVRADVARVARALDGTGARVAPEATVKATPTLLLAPTFLPADSWLATHAVVTDAATAVHGDGRVAVTLEGSEAERLARGDLRPAALARLLPDPLAAPPPEGDDASDAAGRRALERKLLQSLVKPSEGFMSRHVERRISLAVTRRLMNERITPNQMTWISTGVGLLGACCFLFSGRGFAIAGAVLFLVHSILDGCDGELARLRHQESRAGGLLDFWSDNVVHVAVFLALGAGWSREAASFLPLVIAGLAVFGTVFAAAWVHATTLVSRDQGPPGPLYVSVAPNAAASRAVRLADVLSRRDFIWLVLLLAIVGWIRVFLVLAAVGAPLYAALLVWIRIREARHAAGGGPRHEGPPAANDAADVAPEDTFGGPGRPAPPVG